MNFSVSVWSDFYSDLSIEDAIDRLVSCGFSCTELSINHGALLLGRNGIPENIGRELLRFAIDHDFSIPQGHLSYKQGLCTTEAVDILKKQLDLFLGAGIENAVLHFNGGDTLPFEKRFESRISSLLKLVEYINGTPIKLCLENLGSVPETHTVERLLNIINTVGSDHLAICLDTGHLHLVNGRGEARQTQSEFIHGAGKLLRAMHITNNSGAGDDHLMPFSSRYGINWKEVISSIIDIGYSGLFNLEILGEHNCPLPILDAKLKYIKYMTDYMLSSEFINS